MGKGQMGKRASLQSARAAAVTAALLTASCPAWPEEAAGGRSGYIEEIVVTATYRETSLMDTAQAISALDGGQIEDLGAVDMQSLFAYVPGLNMNNANGGSGNNRYSIRGISSPAGTQSFMQNFAAIGVYMDEVSLTSAQGPGRQFGGNLFDVERVEVLKGPQGTLFGEGSVGGTIRFINRKPDPAAFDYKVTGSVADRESSGDLSHRLDAMVNVPLGDPPERNSHDIKKGLAGKSRNHYHAC